MSSLTGNKDVDKMTMRRLDKDDLSNLCQIKNRYIHSLCTDKSLWMLRILDKFKFLVPNSETLNNEQILDELVESYGIDIDLTNDLFWRKFYNYLEYIVDNISELYIRLILQAENDPNYKNTDNYQRKVKQIKNIYELRMANFKRKTGFTNENNDKNRAIAQEKGQEKLKPIILKSEIHNLLKPMIVKMLGQEYANSLALYLKAWTNISLLELFLTHYSSLYGEISDELFSLLYDDYMGLLLDDVAIPESELTQEQKNLLAQNNQALQARFLQEAELIHTFYLMHGGRAGKYGHLRN